MKNKTILSLLIIAFTLSACGVGRSLEKKVDLKIDDSNLYTSFDSKIDKYLNNRHGDDYLNAFDEELRKTLGAYNINVIKLGGKEPSLNNTMYIIELKNLKFLETYENESISAESNYEGQTDFNIVSCKVEIDGYLYKRKNGRKEKIKPLYIYVDKSEKLTTNRTVSQVVSGQNKDNSQYTYKELNKDIFISLSKKAARHLSAKTSRILYKEN